MGNATIVNFAGGETSPKSRGRFDIASYNSSCRKLENFIADVQGSARYRTGFKHLAETAGGAVARLVPFQLNDEQAFMLEFSNLKMRVYRDGVLQTVARTTITGITQANPAVITVTATTGLANGDEVIITGIVGMTELNSRQVKLAGNSGSTFQLVDPTTGTGINSSTFGAYVSGGTLVEIYEIVTPYATADLEFIQFTQSVSTMYLDHYAHAPRKLSVDVLGTWTLATYSRTNDPFTAPPATLTITGVTKAAAGIITFASGASLPVETVTDPYVIAGVVGMTELNGNTYRFYVDGWWGTINLLDTNGNVVNTSGFTTYVSGGTATPTATADQPICPAFYEGRLCHAGTNTRPRTLFLSRSPVPTTGASRFDDFTGGADADHACFFSMAPVAGSVDFITWAGGVSKYLLVGTFGGAFRISGGGLDEPITPSSINVRQIDAYGCAATAPALSGSRAYYIQRGGKTVRGVKYSADADDFASYDLCLNADQIGDSELNRVVFQAGRPDALWVIRADGQLASCTIQEGERIAGWHRHRIGGTAAKVLDVAVLPRPGLNDQIYIVTERTVNGATRRAVEAMADDVVFPDIEDYFTTATTASTDATTYRTAVNALLKTAVHLDAYETYNSTSATVISGLHHLIGQTVTALADGVERVGLVVSAGGAITLPVAASIVHVGLPYTGLLQTQNLEMGGRSGPAQTKPRNINALNIRFLNSKGGKYGTDLYHLFDIETQDPDALTLADGSAAPVFNGIRALQHSDVWSTDTDRNEKTVFIQQTKPFPCIVQFIDIEFETGDE